MKAYNKLVRDNIPAIIKESGKSCQIRTLSHEEFIVELKKKFVEESEELVKTTTITETIEELADIYTLIEALKESINIKEETILNAKNEKNKKRGSFNNKVFLENVWE